MTNAEQIPAPDYVLVVDDDPVLRAIAERHFQKLGSRKLVCANDGVEALDTLDQDREEPAFVLCDLNMPNMDGIEFLRHLEQRKFGGAIAILSSEDDSIIALAESVAKSHKLNVVGKLSKPLKVAQLNELTAAAARNAAAPVTVSASPVRHQDLRNALSANEIVAYHQPKIDARSRAFMGTESLARWHHPEFGVISPGIFVPMAEQCGLIEHLTDRILDKSIADVAAWRAAGMHTSCSVNLSPKVLANINLPDQIAGKVAAAGLEPKQIVLEITESSLLEQDAVPMEVLARLRLKQFDLSIDDFGTGHSNIETLRAFPFCELKIDRSFISNMDRDAFSAECVRTSVELARQLGLRVVAEGVETEAVRDRATAAGADLLQGYLYGKPMPSETLPRWAKGYRVV